MLHKQTRKRVNDGNLVKLHKILVVNTSIKARDNVWIDVGHVFWPNLFLVEQYI